MLDTQDVWICAGVTQTKSWICHRLFCLFVLPLERVPGSYDRKGHLCPSGSRVHWALAEKCVGLRSSLAGWYPVCTSVFIPSVCRSVAFFSLSASHAGFIIHNFAFFVFKWVNTPIYHSPLASLLSVPAVDMTQWRISVSMNYPGCRCLHVERGLW